MPRGNPPGNSRPVLRDYEAHHCPLGRTLRPAISWSKRGIGGKVTSKDQG